MRRIGLVFVLAIFFVIAKFGGLISVDWAQFRVLGELAGIWLVYDLVRSPVTLFIQPPKTGLEQEIAAKIRMIHAVRASGKNVIQVFVIGSGWLEGKVLELSESRGVLLLEVGDGLGSELIFVKDVVRLRTSVKRLSYLLADDEDRRKGMPELALRSIDTPITDSIF